MVDPGTRAGAFVPHDVVRVVGFVMGRVCDKRRTFIVCSERVRDRERDREHTHTTAVYK